MLKVLSLFSGIGAFEKALENMGVPCDLVAFCEIDKYATKSYCAIHGVSEDKNLGDITKVDAESLLKDIDVLTYGFPCQDISIAGHQKGLFDEDGSQTRSGLFFEALRIIEATKPKIAIAENVKNLVGKKFQSQFQIVLAALEAAGYKNYWQVLNAKDYGVPQNRERVFIVSIREDIDNGRFEFPAPFPLDKRLKDVLEDKVDEKFYISQTMLEGFIAHKERHRQRGHGFGFKVVSEDNPAPCIPARYYRDGSNCLIVREATKAGYAIALEGDFGRGVAQTLTTSCNQAVVEPTLATCIGGIGEKKSNGGQQFYQQDRVYQGDIALAHPASIPGGSYRYAVEEQQNLRIRKLTPKECFRLMGFDDEAFHRAEGVNSNTQLYKQAGNSIVVDVLVHLFSKMLDKNGNIAV